MKKIVPVLISTTMISILILSISPAAVVFASSPTCTPAGATGLTTKVVATTNEHITAVVNAAGCDIGIYVGPGVTGVTIYHSTIYGANDHGVFVQDSSGDNIAFNHVVDNGVAPHACSLGPPTGPCIAEDKAIDMVGTSNSRIANNVVKDNFADGGIAINDDGPLDPGALLPGPATSVASNNNLVVDNLVSDNVGGCGIVLSSYNHQSVSYNMISGNTVIGGWKGVPFMSTPLVGGIVVAGDLLLHNQVVGNTVDGSVIPGITVHASSPGDKVSGTVITGNTLESNGFEGCVSLVCIPFLGYNPNDAPAPVGINIVSESPGAVVASTSISSNTVNSNYYGVWYCGVTGLNVHGESGSPAVSLASCTSMPSTGVSA